MSDEALDESSADALAGKICAAASVAAQSECQLIELIGEFDAGDAVRWWDGVKSLAHWLSWACSMSPGTAREHVRVARALRRMPTIRQAFREGRLSYSKVREATRVVDLVDDAELCELALTATAAQLARTVSGYRTAAGTRIHQGRDRGLTWTERENGTIDLRLRLPKEEAAVLLAAIAAAQDQFGSPPPTDADADTDTDTDTDTAPAYTSADGILDVARGFLQTAPEDRSGEDRTLVVVHVGLDQLSSDGGSAVEPVGDVPAGTSSLPQAASPPLPPTPARQPTCHVQGLSGIEAETARRLACDSDLLGAVLDRHRGVLALGRTHRLVSRTQRRALIIRDQARCQFTGCHQSRHLKAHHLIHWADGGPTDLDNLILLCQFHHTAVHEGQMTIHRTHPASGPGSWEFRMPDGTPHRDWYTAEGLLNFLTQHADRNRAEDQHRQRLSMITTVTGFHHPDAQRIQPGWRGERYDRHEAVQALFRMPVRASENQKAA
ncbi:HNH endonuclease signature motif containing protein [Microlunatus aurantiacus]|uniref:HNH endonuclease signature motif containing protein n=1 Tax=Microlunatus aurantiacus TaxID=446786 RepID=A0ABP7CPV5_9ACTN